MDNKDLENLTAAIVSSQLTLHYLEQIKHTRYYRGKVKETLRAATIQLLKVESNEFEKINEINEEITHQVSSNLMEVISLMLAGGFSNMMLLGNLQHAYYKNPKAIEGIVNKVLNSTE